ncbi:hypothetical protein DY000_02011536 [Brassica cretica]|uniref:Uncharacterized protein n=1 Tax=Brassica cretica TaxID=69181 RepID=A0ABQ7DAA7_BRACR|nr:hypothetical protein DY000_02011536 [Brassica cretica]
MKKKFQRKAPRSGNLPETEVNDVILWMPSDVYNQDECYSVDVFLMVTIRMDVQQRKITVSVSDLLLVFGCTGSEVSGSVQHLELFEEVKGYLSGCSVRPDPGRLGRGRCLTSLSPYPDRTSKNFALYLKYRPLARANSDPSSRLP